MNVDERIEAGLRGRPSEERNYVEPLTALVASAGAGVQRVRPVVRSRGRTGGLAAVAIVVVLLAAGIGLATVGLPNGTAIGPPVGSGQPNGSKTPRIEVTIPSGPVVSPACSIVPAAPTTQGCGASPITAPSAASAGGPTPAATFLMYYVVSGDYMSKIAARFNLQLWELKLANPQVADLNHIVIGQLLRIPSPGQLSRPSVAPASS
jgi:LysM repeat protein